MSDTIRITDFAGWIPNADEADLVDGGSPDMQNISLRTLGALRTRPGLQKVDASAAGGAILSMAVMPVGPVPTLVWVAAGALQADALE